MVSFLNYMVSGVGTPQKICGIHYTYRTGEFAYVMLSLISKSSLAWMFFINVKKF
jgi:hypothetical protein